MSAEKRRSSSTTFRFWRDLFADYKAQGHGQDPGASQDQQGLQDVGNRRAQLVEDGPE